MSSQEDLSAKPNPQCLSETAAFNEKKASSDFPTNLEVGTSEETADCSFSGTESIPAGENVAFKDAASASPSASSSSVTSTMKQPESNKENSATMINKVNFSDEDLVYYRSKEETEDANNQLLTSANVPSSGDAENGKSSSKNNDTSNRNHQEKSDNCNAAIIGESDSGSESAYCSVSDNLDNDDHDRDKVKTNTSESYENKSDGALKLRKRGRPSSCVFVASLSASRSDDELCNSVQEHFQQWGWIALVKVLRDPNNRPYAFVQYDSDEDAAAALTGAQHSMLNGRIIRVEPARVNRTLYITPLRESLAEETTVYQFLSQFGEVEQLVHTKVPLGTYKKSKNWYVKFAYRDDAIRAYASLRVDKDWSAEWSQNLDTPANQSAIDKESIFVGQLDHHVSEELLVERFSRHGEVVQCNVIIRKPQISEDGSELPQRNNSFAFIKFDSEQAAAEAVEQENHTVFMDKTMHVQYRELNHHHQTTKNSSEFKLNLAPPPISLPKRETYDSHHFGNNHMSYNKPQQRINARHSSMPVTPMPNSKRYPQQGNKWRSSSYSATSMRPVYYYHGGGNKPSPEQELSMQAQHGSSPFNSPTPTSFSASPASFRQSPQSTISSTSSSKGASSWGSRKGSLESVTTSATDSVYSPPHKRDRYSSGSGYRVTTIDKFKEQWERQNDRLAPSASQKLEQQASEDASTPSRKFKLEQVRPFVPRNAINLTRAGEESNSGSDSIVNSAQFMHSNGQASPNSSGAQMQYYTMEDRGLGMQAPPGSAAGSGNGGGYYPPQPIPIMGVPPQYFPYDGGVMYPPPYYYGYHYPFPAPAPHESKN